jgi:hypothetical protein
MIPSYKQYRTWSLPSKWTFWSAIIGLPVGIVSLLVTFFPLSKPDAGDAERRLLLFRVAQELRYNHAWLSEVALAVTAKSEAFPAGSLKTDALVDLANREHQQVVKGAYGEEKHIYQEILRLKDWGVALSSPQSYSQVQALESWSTNTLHDILFLNEFLRWYLSPLIMENMDQTQLRSLGWDSFPGDHFEIRGINELKMKEFTDGDVPITDFGDYLGLLD